MDDDKAHQLDETMQQEQDKEDEGKESSTAPSTSLAPPPPAPTSGSSVNLANFESTASGQVETLLSPVQRPATAPTAPLSPTHHSALVLPSPFHSPTSLNQQQRSSPPADEASRPPSSISGIRPAESAVASHLQYQALARVPLFLPPLFNPSSLSGPSSAFAYPGPGYHFPPQQPQSAHAAFPPHPSPFSPPSLAAASTMQQVEAARSPSAGASVALSATEEASAPSQEGGEEEKTVNLASGNEVEKVEVGEEEERERRRKMSLMALVDATDKVEKEGGAGETASEEKVGEQEEEEGMVTRARGRKRSLETASPPPPTAVQATTTEDVAAEEAQEETPATAPEKRRRTTTSEVDPSLRQAAQQQSVQPHPQAQRIAYPTQQQYLGQIYPIHPSPCPPANSSSAAAPGHPHPYTQQPHPHSQQTHPQLQHQQQHFYPSVGWSPLAPPSAPHFPPQQSMARWDGNMPAFLAGQYPSVMGRHGATAAAFSMPAREEEEVGAEDEGERGEGATAQQEEGMERQEVDSEERGGRSATSPTSATAPSSYWTTTSPSLSTAYQTSPPQPTSSYPYGHASASSPILARGYPPPQYAQHAQQQYPQQQHYLQQQRPPPPPQPAQATQQRPIAPPPGGQPEQIPLVSSSSSTTASSSRQVFGAGPDEEEGQEEGDSQQEQVEQGQVQPQQGQKGVGKGKGARMAPPTNAFNVPTTEGVKPFINKLRWLLQHPELVGESICWSESGNEVLLHVSGETDLTESVLPRMYSHSNLGAFYRQFTVYGFTHIKDPTRISSILNPHLPQPSTSSAAQPSAAESFAGFSPSPPAPVPVPVSETRDPNEWRVYSHLHSVADYEAAFLAERREEGEMRRARRSTARAAAVAAGGLSIEEEESEESEGEEAEVPEEPEEERYWFSRDNVGEERLLRRVKGKGAKDKSGAGGADGKGKGKGKGKKPASPGKGKKAAQVAAAMSPSPSPLIQHQPLPAQYQPYAPYHAGNVVPALPLPQQQHSPSGSNAALPTSYAQYQAQHPHAQARVSVAVGGGGGGGGGGGAMSGLLQHQGVATRGRTAVQGLLRGGEGGVGRESQREVERAEEEGEGDGEETA